jgi:ATP-dependent exoDNAse (exonuclease V) beta subunit
LLDQVIDPQGGGASSQGGQGWMNIRTIHSFCQSLLQQFAFEAGLPPALPCRMSGKVIGCAPRPCRNCWPTRPPIISR